MSKFKVGDEVKCIADTEDPHLIGMIGKVIGYGSTENICHVDFGKVIKQSNNSYNETTHDFYVKELKSYIEIKGWMNERSKKIMIEFNNLYPNDKLILLQKNDLIKMKVL